MIPLLDLKTQNADLQSEIDAALLRVAHSGRYILGPEVEAFEAEWAAYCGVKYCVGTGNALDALRMIMMSFGVGRGDEVIVPSNTYIATWLAVTQVGARPAPVEPSYESFNLDPSKVESAITDRTKAILAVHLYGRCADMDALNDIGSRAGVYVIADAAQAHGATYRGRKAGGLCSAEAFSFYPSKNLGALGDGGAVTTNDEMLANRIRRLRHYGGVGRLDHRIKGINSRLDEMQAAVLRVKLPHLDAANDARRERARLYQGYLAHTGLVLPNYDGNCWHQYVVRSSTRDQLATRLEAQGIEAHVHYPVPPHLEGAYSEMRRPSLPIAERLAREVLSLPIGYDIDVTAISAAVRGAT